MASVPMSRTSKQGLCLLSVWDISFSSVRSRTVASPGRGYHSTPVKHHGREPRETPELHGISEGADVL